MARPRVYTDKQILDRLREHCIDNLGSVHSMHKPSWNGVQKRMKQDEEFSLLVMDLVAEAVHEWEKMGIAALTGNDENFNVQLFKHFTMNKKPFLTHETLEVEKRLNVIESELEKR